MILGRIRFTKNKKAVTAGRQNSDGAILHQ